MSTVKTCNNCTYRDGWKFENSKCLLSGFSCRVERSMPSVCGDNFENWKQRSPSVWQKIFFREKQK